MPVGRYDIFADVEPPYPMEDGVIVDDGVTITIPIQRSVAKSIVNMMYFFRTEHGGPCGIEGHTCPDCEQIDLFEERLKKRIDAGE